MERKQWKLIILKEFQRLLMEKNYNFLIKSHLELKKYI
jgi:hypothetical protein